MTRTEALKHRVAHLGVAPEDMTDRFVAARAAPVVDVERGRLGGRRYTDIGPSGPGMYEIVDDKQGAFINVPVSVP